MYTKDVKGRYVFGKEEAFFAGEKIAIDAEVKVLYQEDEKNIVGQYIIFSKVYNEQRKLHGATKEAITETIRICKDRNVLKEYLESREQEVVDMIMTLFDDDQIMKAYTKDVEESVARKTAKETAKETERKTAIQMIKKGKLSIDEISEYFPELSESDIKEIEAEVLQFV